MDNSCRELEKWSYLTRTKPFQLIEPSDELEAFIRANCNEVRLVGAAADEALTAPLGVGSLSNKLEALPLLAASGVLLTIPVVLLLLLPRIASGFKELLLPAVRLRPSLICSSDSVCSIMATLLRRSDFLLPVAVEVADGLLETGSFFCDD